MPDNPSEKTNAVLNICNGYTISKLYDELFSRFSSFGYFQDVVAPTFEIPSEVETRKYKVNLFAREKSLVNRVFYTRKLSNIFNRIEQDYEPGKFGLIHAHTLFSDGIPAYRLFKKHGTPYIVAVRNSDINFFFKYFIHYRGLAHRVLQNASAIILISPAYLQRLQNSIPTHLFQSIKSKIKIIPNGINQLWLDNRYVKTLDDVVSSSFNIVYCGTFDKNKNIDGLINGFQKASLKHKDLKLTLVGLKDGLTSKYIDNIKDSVASSNESITLCGRMTMDQLMPLYRQSSLFAMPSHTETFGLVYVEALSQGMPIIYTRNEGFDGFFEDNTVGIAVNSKSSESICEAICNIKENYNHYIKNISDIDFSEFQWDKIALKYKKIYDSLF